MLILNMRFLNSIIDIILAFFTKKTSVYAQNQELQKKFPLNFKS